MSPDRVGKMPPRNQPEMPSYFRMDRHHRDEFLSQLGHFSEEHRALFSRLCDMWEPDLPHSKFFAKAGHEFLNTEASLHTLITHLEKGNCGLISMMVRDGQLEKDRIILTDRDAPRFWYWYVENLWQTCRVSDRDPFPTVKAVSKRGGFAADILQPLSLAEISGSFVQSHSDEVALYALPDLDGKILIVTPAAIPLMVDVARVKIRAHLADSPVLPVLARFMGTVVSSMRKSLIHSEDLFWNKLSDAIVIHKEDLLAKKANLAMDLFIAAKILKIYTRNELDEAEQRREMDAEKRETMIGILGHLAKKENFLSTPDEFSSQFEPYKEKWPDIKEVFMAQYMKPAGRTGLPAVLNIGEDFIYRDHLYPLFKTQHKTACLELRDFYLDMMERMLKTNNKGKITAFAGIGSFREDIRERLALEFQVLSDMLSKPRIVSEGIIHYATKVLKISDMDKVKTILARYFETGSIKFMHPDKLFELEPDKMFDEAYRRLSWFKRLMLKLFGRYESYLQAMSSTSIRMAGNGANVNDPAAVAAAAKELSVRPYRAPMPVVEGAMDQAVRRRKQSAAAKKRYTMKQQERAWDEFKDAYDKKKGR